MHIRGSASQLFQYSHTASVVGMTMCYQNVVNICGASTDLLHRRKNLVGIARQSSVNQCQLA